MKKIMIVAVLIIFAIAGCKQPKSAPPVTQAGVYKLEKQMVSGGGKDTVYKRIQRKIYTDDHFMYAAFAPDSSVGFGVGSYKMDSVNKMTEQNIYSSRLLDSAGTFNLEITRTARGYTQVIPTLAKVRDVTYKMIEDYTTVPPKDTTALDGLWKMESAYVVTGKDTVNLKPSQYKIFQKGYFMFVHRYTIDKEGKKFKNGFGYGVFSLRNDTLREEDELSSHAQLLHRKFAIKITFKGNDEYSQVITDSVQKSIEIYRRIR
ncbi:hypothetical protein [Mucilaginibacter aquaedulcis]|jgi:hypothetical protein|uniref:hypothetical protein n=1 Tax=Mucilaginibacter aquaedulcis TaxID=1187081 RepID=UPI0025B2FB23|nr:hypothetical protein [Mucilaginibacter aquaedulcis]MDN3551372.1 hypothetical protein [Mucilaginibacter aquaedulcis]